MRPLFFALLIAGTTTFVAQAQAPVAPTAPADGLTRQERRELARRVAAEARRPKTVLSNRDREMSEALFVDGVKYVLLEDYNKALERLLKAYDKTRRVYRNGLAVVTVERHSIGDKCTYRPN